MDEVIKTLNRKRNQLNLINPDTIAALGNIYDTFKNELFRELQMVFTVFIVWDWNWWS